MWKKILIERINDKVKPDIEMFADVRDQIDLDIREGDVEQRLKQAENMKLSSTVMHPFKTS